MRVLYVKNAFKRYSIIYIRIGTSQCIGCTWSRARTTCCMWVKPRNLWLVCARISKVKVRRVLALTNPNTSPQFIRWVNTRRIEMARTNILTNKQTNRTRCGWSNDSSSSWYAIYIVTHQPMGASFPLIKGWLWEVRSARFGNHKKGPHHPLWTRRWCFANAGFRVTLWRTDIGSYTCVGATTWYGWNETIHFQRDRHAMFGWKEQRRVNRCVTIPRPPPPQPLAVHWHFGKGFRGLWYVVDT